MMKKFFLILFCFCSLFHVCGRNKETYLFVQRILPSELPDEDFFAAPCNVLGKRIDKYIRVGNSITINLLGYTPQYQVALLKRILDLSQQTDIPIHIHLDGQNWINARPDLWNWFDEKKPGYNPENKMNVEWTSWSPDSAVKICWRDWGRQLRILPAPNIFSPRIMQAHQEALGQLLPIIAAWKKNLPISKKYLFGGIRLGWEAGFNYNAYYYRNGNDLYERDSKYDPLKRESVENFAERNNTQLLGYAAAYTLGLKREGELTNHDYEQMIHIYLLSLCRQVASYEFHPNEVFTHMGGNYAPFDKHLQFWPAINRYATPGWSFYSMNPSQAGSLPRELKQYKCRKWAASEWYWPGKTSQEWSENLFKTYSFNNCCLIVIYNWEHMIENDTIAQQGIIQLHL